MILILLKGWGIVYFKEYGGNIGIDLVMKIIGSEDVSERM